MPTTVPPARSGSSWAGQTDAVSRAHLEAFVAVLFLGTVPVSIRAIHADPWVIGLVRLLVATVLAGFFLRGSRGFRALKRRELGAVALIGVVFALHWAAYFVSIKMSTASVAAIGTATFGIHVAVLGRIMLRQVPTLIQWLSLAVGFCGTLLVMGEFSFRDEIARGFLLAVFSAFIYAFLPILHQRNVGIPVNVRTLGQYAFALPLFLFLLPLMNWDFRSADWLGLTYLAVFGTFVAHTLWIRGTSVLPTHVSGMIYYLYVPIAMTLSHLLLGEPLVPSRIAGACLIVAASCVGVFSQARLRA
jgi:drug/metabolite transporter (DMT)-like permease